VLRRGGECRYPDCPFVVRGRVQEVIGGFAILGDLRVDDAPHAISKY
jgi:hypothetical protein